MHATPIVHFVVFEPFLIPKALNLKYAYKRGCTVTGNSHFLKFLRLLDKDTQTKWRPQTTGCWNLPLLRSMKAFSHEQGLQILPKPTHTLKPRPITVSVARWLCVARVAHQQATPLLSHRKGSCTCSLLCKTWLVYSLSFPLLAFFTASAWR